MKERQESVQRIVKVDIGVNPAVSPVKACGFVWHHSSVIFHTMCINTFEEFPAKKVHSHDAEDQPEHHTDEENIGDTRDGVEKRTDYDLEKDKKDSLRGVRKLCEN